MSTGWSRKPSLVCFALVCAHHKGLKKPAMMMKYFLCDPYLPVGSSSMDLGCTFCCRSTRGFLQKTNLLLATTRLMARSCANAGASMHLFSLAISPESSYSDFTLVSKI